MRAESGAAASAFAALTPKGGSCSAASLLFQGPSIPALPVKAEGGQSRWPVEAGEPAVQEKEHARGDPLAREFPPPPPESLPLPPHHGEGCAKAPLPADQPRATAAPSNRPMSPNPVPRSPPLPPPTPLSPRTPVTRCTDKKAATREVREDQLKELKTKLERLQAHLDQSPGKVTDVLLPDPPVPNPYNSSSLPAPPCAVPWDGGLGTGGGSGVQWRGIATVMAVAVGVAVQPLVAKQKREKQARSCFNCGKRGHFWKECGVKGPVSQGGRKRCVNCKRDNHNTSECRKSGNRSVVRLGCVAENRGLCACRSATNKSDNSPCFSSCQKHD